jgi:hypothetical protein
MTPAMRDLLTIARDQGSVAAVIAVSGGITLEDAELNGYIRVIHRTAGVVGASWAAWTASDVQQRDDLTVQLTPAGRNHLEAS